MKPQVDFALQIELLVPQIYFLKLDGNFLLVLEVEGFPYFPEGSFSELFCKLIFLTDYLIFLNGHYNYKKIKQLNNLSIIDFVILFNGHDKPWDFKGQELKIVFQSFDFIMSKKSNW